jgi:hypothetical protein
MDRLSDIPLMKALVKQTKAREVTPAKQKLLDAAGAIRQNPEEAEAAFLARQLVQCTLPHSNPGKVEAWKRTNGNLTLVIRAGWDSEKDQSIGYPYGSLPRLLLFWVTTEAIRTKSRRLALGHSLSEFMRVVGLDPYTGGGKRSDAKRLQEQMRRLFRATISFEMQLWGPDRQGVSWLDMQVAPKGELWWDPKSPDQSLLWGSWIELGEDFFKAITAAPVPLDLRALRALKRSPLALDLYALAAYKAFIANKSGAQFIPWEGLARQLGANYDVDRLDRVKDKVKAAMRKVSTVFPGGLKYAWSREGLSLLPGTKLAVDAKPKAIETTAS